MEFQIEVYHYWLIGAIIFAALEIFIPGFVIIWFSVGCLAGALAAKLDAGTNWSLFIFAVTSVSLATLSHFIFKKFIFPRQAEAIKTNVDAMIGREAIVLQPLENEHKTGLVKIGGESWSALADKNEYYPLELDAIVEIVRIEGVKVFVKPLDAEKEDAAG